MRRARLLPVLSVLLAAGCTVGPDYRAPAMPVPAAFGEAGASGAAGVTQTPPVAAWWKTFGDPTLDSLVERAVRANPDLLRAAARVREARAARGIAGSDAWPTLDATGGASRKRSSGNTGQGSGGTSNLFEAGFDAIWELDVFGRTRREVEAADADLAAREEDRRDVLVSLVAEVARNYVELRGARRQAAIAKANLESQRQTLDLNRTRLEAGLATELDVVRAEGQTAATESAIPTFESAARRAAHALAVLLGAEPNALVGELGGEAPIPAPPPEVPVGLPSDLLLRRPDVRRAERELAAATARIGVAKADWFPRFSLTGAFGRSSEELGEFFAAGSGTASAGAAVGWRVLDFGRIRGNVGVADARTEQAAAAYESTVLTSLREVEDAIVTYDRERTRRSSLAVAERASRRAVELANDLWTAGRTDFLDVLDAQRNLFLAQDALVDSDRRAAADLVALYKALGGGWDVAEAAPAK